MLLFSIVSTADADTSMQTSYLKAAFFHRFANYVQWGQSHPERLTYCIYRSQEVFATLKALLKDEQLAEVRRIDSASAAKRCEMLFIGDVSQTELDQILSSLGESHTVTVSDRPGFANSGGIIELVMVGKHMRFVINSKAAEKQHVFLSSQLLALAQQTIR